MVFDIHLNAHSYYSRLGSIVSESVLLKNYETSAKLSLNICHRIIGFETEIIILFQRNPKITKIKIMSVTVKIYLFSNNICPENDIMTFNYLEKNVRGCDQQTLGYKIRQETRGA